MFRSLKSALQDLGFFEGTLYLVGRALQAVSNGRWYLIRYYIVAQPVPSPFVPVCRPSETERVGEAKASDAIVPAFPRPPQVIDLRFRKGHVCLVAVARDTFAGFLWYALDAYDEDEVHCRFTLAAPKVSVWDYDVHVEPRFRMGRTFARLWDAANLRLAAAGVQWSFSRISAFNRQSLQSHARLGIKKLHSLTFISFGSLQLSLLSCLPYVSICWKGRTPPEVILRPPRVD